MDSITQYLELPVSNPTGVFSIVLAIILFAPILFSKIKIPHIVGLIISGVIIGENGLGILERDDSFRLFGQVGIYYIMFLAGLEMDLAGMKESRKPGGIFGAMTALIPFATGYLTGLYILHYSHLAALLLACIFASHTLVAYPIVSRYQLNRQKSVMVSVMATMIALIFALITLALIAASFKGEDIGWKFWMWILAKFALLIVFVTFVMPRVIRFFFKKVSEPILHFIFVLVMIYVAATMADLAGFEGILGAFFAGLVFNRYIPHNGPLMNRVEFVGNAIFIPFFLIGVGMLVNVRPMFTNKAVIGVVAVIVVASTLSKYVAAWISRRMLKLSKGSGLMMFGLSEAHAAGALAMVMVGTSLVYPDGTPLMSSDVLDGVVVMILISCLISSIATEKAAKQLKTENIDTLHNERPENDDEKILVAINDENSIKWLVGTAGLMRNEKLKRGIICLNVVNDNEESKKKMMEGKAYLEEARKLCSASNLPVQTQLRLGVNFANATIHAFRENDASEVIMGLHTIRADDTYFLGLYGKALIGGLMRQITIVKFTVKEFNNIRQILVAVPENAEHEAGFYRWLERICRMSQSMKCQLEFHATEKTCNIIMNYIKAYYSKLTVDYEEFAMREGLDQLKDEVHPDHLLVVVMARQGTASYQASFRKLQEPIEKHFSKNSLMIIVPDQQGDTDNNQVTFTDLHSQDDYVVPGITQWMSKFQTRTI